MRHLVRLSKPTILVQKENLWTQSYINSSNVRPDNKKYGHKEIRTVLNAISFKKCFYSEVKFATENEGQIDHYVEVSENRNLAFNWDNLYLSHKDSNQGKSSNITIPNVSTINPFLDDDAEIEKHLYFEDENITSNTQKGLNTIQKYNLDKDIFNILRSKELRKFEQCLIEIQKIIISENRKISNAEIEILNNFAQPDKSFSLMFRLVLKKHNLFNN